MIVLAMDSDQESQRSKFDVYYWHVCICGDWSGHVLDDARVDGGDHDGDENFNEQGEMEGANSHSVLYYL